MQGKARLLLQSRRQDTARRKCRYLSPKSVSPLLLPGRAWSFYLGRDRAHPAVPATWGIMTSKHGRLFRSLVRVQTGFFASQRPFFKPLASR